MYRTLSKLRQKRAQGENGFTLIELLVVVVILGILIAIAIPLYLNYRKGANDSAAKSDMRNAINVLEQCNTDTAYPTAAFTLVTSGVAGTCAGQTINLSGSTSMTYTPSGQGYYLVDNNSSGATGTSAKFYCYHSLKGGAVTSLTTVPASLAAGVTAVGTAGACT